MRWRRELAAMVAEAEATATPDAWALAAGVVREELERRQEVRRVVAGLSPDAWCFVRTLHDAGGRAFLPQLPGRLHDLLRAAFELEAAGVVSFQTAVDEAGEPAELILVLDYLAELPEG